MDVILCWPKTRSFDSYMQSLAQAKAENQTILFKVPSWPTRLAKGDRAYQVYDGRIWGYCLVLDTIRITENVRRSDIRTGEYFSPGIYIVRDPTFMPIPIMQCPSFRGFRYVDRMEIGFTNDS